MYKSGINDHWQTEEASHFRVAHFRSIIFGCMMKRSFDSIWYNTDFICTHPCSAENKDLCK